MNNVIKQIKHTACGYRKFKHLKARIMLIKGLLILLKHNKRELKFSPLYRFIYH